MSALHVIAQLFTYNGPKTLTDDGSGSLQAILKLLFGTLGAISVLVLIIAGIRLTTSRGNPDAIAKLRNTIIYAGVGLAVAIGAAVILQFVITRVK